MEARARVSGTCDHAGRNYFWIKLKMRGPQVQGNLPSQFGSDQFDR